MSTCFAGARAVCHALPCSRFPPLLMHRAGPLPSVIRSYHDGPVLGLSHRGQKALPTLHNMRSGAATCASHLRRHSLGTDVVAAATPAAGSDDSSGQQKYRGRPSSVPWLVGPLAAAAAVAGSHWAVSSGTAALLLMRVKHYMASSVLAKSGFFAAFSLIFLSEIGDKTFFIAALLAMRCGKWVSFVGSTAALVAMTIISVSIGFAVKRVPTVVQSSEVLGQWAGAALLAYFGLHTLKNAWEKNEKEGDNEFADATEQVQSAEKGGKIHHQQAPIQSLLEVATLIFVAEWGDRSMLATIALGAVQSPLGVAGGAIVGHTLATLIAVVGGAMLSRHISERMVSLVGGMLFLLFAGGTLVGCA